MIRLYQAVLPGAMRLFEDAKQRTFFFSNIAPTIDARITVNIPNTSRILLLLAERTNSTEELERAFLELKKVCQTLERELRNYVNEIDKIINILNRVNQTFGSFDGILTQLLQLIPVFNSIIAAGQIILAAQVFPVANGALIIRTGDAINLLKGKIKEIQGLGSLITNTASFFNRETSLLLSILNPVRSEILNILTILQTRCLLIDSLYLEELKKYNLNSATNNSQTNEEIIDTLGGIYKPEIILDNLENSNKSQFIEYLVENGHTGYQITKG